MHRVGPILAFAAAVALAAPPATAAGQVIYTSTQRISRLTASGGRLAWAQQPVEKTYCFRVYEGTVAGAAPVRITRCRIGTRRAFGWMQPWTRIAGSGVFWQEAGFGNTEIDEWIYWRFPGRQQAHTTYTTGCGGTPGRMLGPIATGAMVFTVFTPVTDGGCDLTGGTGVVRRTVVTGTTVSRPIVPGAPAADLLAVTASRLLEVPAAITAMQGLEPTTTLELRGLRSGAQRWSQALAGTPRAVAASPAYATALVHGAGGMSIRAYAAGSGAPVRALTVRGSVLPMLAMVGPRVVFAYPGSIMVWNVRTNTLHRLRLTPAPHNLSADGRLVVWNTAHTIRGVTLRPLG
jgi:hypothetical protein